MKARISFDLDLDQLAPDALGHHDIERVALDYLIKPARVAQQSRLQRARENADEAALNGALRGMMATLMAEANMRVEILSQDAPVSTELPFERQHD